MRFNFLLLIILIILIFTFQTYRLRPIKKIPNHFTIQLHLDEVVSTLDIAPYSLLSEVVPNLHEYNLSSLNLTKPLMHGDVIVLKKKNTLVTCISLNQASDKELVTLPGVGPKLAVAIKEFQLTYGFKNLEDLLRVKGIGTAKFEKMKEFICL